MDIDRNARRPVYREFVELDPREFAALHSAHGDRSTWPEEREAVSAVLKRWESLLETDGPLPSEKTVPLSREVNKHLEKYVTLKLFGDLRTLAPVSKSGVIGLVWLRLAKAIAGQGDLRECLQCHNEFAASRSDKRFDRPACKLRWSRAHPTK